MENKHSSNGIAEDIIRSFVQVASTELHTKTNIEKRISELDNGMVDEVDVSSVLEEIDTLKNDLEEQAQVRRELMLYLYKMYGEKGQKEQWCVVKHMGMAMYTCFEAYQASNQDGELLTLYLQLNKQFIKAVSKFLGIEITECASCFSDILKAEEVH